MEVGGPVNSEHETTAPEIQMGPPILKTSNEPDKFMNITAQEKEVLVVGMCIQHDFMMYRYSI